MAEEKKEQIEEKLNKLIAEAEEKGMWLWHPYQDSWFSPDELRKEHIVDRWVHESGWKLRDPKEYLAIYADQAVNAIGRFIEIKNRIAEWRIKQNEE